MEINSNLICFYGNIFHIFVMCSHDKCKFIKIWENTREFFDILNKQARYIYSWKIAKVGDESPTV